MPGPMTVGSRGGSPSATPGLTTLDLRSVVRRVVGIVCVLGFVFGIVLPRVVDYETVRAAFAALGPSQLALLVASSAVAYVASAGPTRALIAGISWPQAVGSDLAARAVVSTVPGPTDAATRYVLYRQWSIPADVASSGIVLASLFETFASFALPVIAAAALLVGGQPAPSQAIPLALAGLVVLTAAAALLVAIVRSERLALRLGGWLEGMAGRISALLHRTPPSGVVEGILDLHERSKAMLTGRGILGFVAAVVGRLAWFVVLEVALWCVGVGPDVLPPSAVLATVGVVGVVSLVPITPGAVGVAEVAYIGILSSVTGPGATDQLTAAVSLFRIAQWFAPIVIGWVLLVVMRRGQPGGLLGDPRAGGAPLVSPA